MFFVNRLIFSKSFLARFHREKYPTIIGLCAERRFTPHPAINAEPKILRAALFREHSRPGHGAPINLMLVAAATIVGRQKPGPARLALFVIVRT